MLDSNACPEMRLPIAILLVITIIFSAYTAFIENMNNKTKQADIHISYWKTMPRPYSNSLLIHIESEKDTKRFLSVNNESGSINRTNQIPGSLKFEGTEFYFYFTIPHYAVSRYGYQYLKTPAHIWFDLDSGYFLFYVDPQIVINIPQHK